MALERRTRLAAKAAPGTFGQSTLAPGKGFSRPAGPSAAPAVTRPSRAATAPARPRPANSLPDVARAVAYGRFDGRCAVCGGQLRAGWRSIQHRKRGQAGGTSDRGRHGYPNLLGVCGRNAGEGCHHTSDEGPDRHICGLQVRQWEDPAVVPVRLWDGRSVLLTADGGFEAVPADP